MSGTNESGNEILAKLRGFVVFIAKAAGLGLAMFVAFMVASAITAADVAAETAPQDVNQMMVWLLAVSMLDAVILGFIIHNSRWRGWPLILGLAVALYGVQTVMGQIEALVFLTPLGERWGAGSVPMLVMPFELIASNIISGAVKAMVGATVGVLLFGKARRGEFESTDFMPKMEWQQWALKIGAAVLLYELLYFGFGYYVAWKSPALLDFYQGSDPGSFLAQMRNVIGTTPTLIPFQALRSLLWIAFSLPIIRMLRHKPWLGASATGLMLGLLAFSHTLVPNPYMPTEVRIVHFIETVSSTFIFGVALYGLFHRRHQSPAGLLKADAGDSEASRSRHSGYMGTEAR